LGGKDGTLSHMISAFLNGALSRKQKNMEDLLTSCVFDALRYSGSNKHLIEWLWSARTINSEFPFLNISKKAKVKHLFWHPLEEENCVPCIPDVILDITDGPDVYAVLIEAKYRSGKSAHADKSADKPHDQLAKEWHNLVNMVERENKDRSPYLVYLTASVGLPRADIEESLEDIGNDISKPDDCISWLSWRHLAPLIQDSDIPSIHDLWSLLDRLGLVIFDGFHAIKLTDGISWGFDNLGATTWIKTIPQTNISWRFINET